MAIPDKKTADAMLERYRRDPRAFIEEIYKTEMAPAPYMRCLLHAVRSRNEVIEFPRTESFGLVDVPYSRFNYTQIIISHDIIDVDDLIDWKDPKP